MLRFSCAFVDMRLVTWFIVLAGIVASVRPAPRWKFTGDTSSQWKDISIQNWKGDPLGHSNIDLSETSTEIDLVMRMLLRKGNGIRVPETLSIIKERFPESLWTEQDVVDQVDTIYESFIVPTTYHELLAASKDDPAEALEQKFEAQMRGHLRDKLLTHAKLWIDICISKLPMLPTKRVPCTPVRVSDQTGRTYDAWALTIPQINSILQASINKHRKEMNDSENNSSDEESQIGPSLDDGDSWLVDFMDESETHTPSIKRKSSGASISTKRTKRTSTPTDDLMDSFMDDWDPEEQAPREQAESAELLQWDVDKEDFWWVNLPATLMWTGDATAPPISTIPLMSDLLFTVSRVRREGLRGSEFERDWFTITHSVYGTFKNWVASEDTSKPPLERILQHSSSIHPMVPYFAAHAWVNHARMNRSPVFFNHERYAMTPEMIGEYLQKLEGFLVIEALVNHIQSLDLQELVDYVGAFWPVSTSGIIGQVPDSGLSEWLIVLGEIRQNSPLNRGEQIMEQVRNKIPSSDWNASTISTKVAAFVTPLMSPLKLYILISRLLPYQGMTNLVLVGTDQILRILPSTHTISDWGDWLMTPDQTALTARMQSLITAHIEKEELTEVKKLFIKSFAV